MEWSTMDKKYYNLQVCGGKIKGAIHWLSSDLCEVEELHRNRTTLTGFESLMLRVWLSLPFLSLSLNFFSFCLKFQFFYEELCSLCVARSLLTLSPSVVSSFLVSSFCTRPSRYLKPESLPLIIKNKWVNNFFYINISWLIWVLFFLITI